MSSGTGVARDRPQRALRIGKVVQYPDRHDHVERPGAERQVLGIRLHGEDRCRQVAAGHVDRRPEIDGDDVGAGMRGVKAVSP